MQIPSVKKTNYATKNSEHQWTTCSQQGCSKQTERGTYILHNALLKQLLMHNKTKQSKTKDNE
jgi:hypothetical protein